MKLTKNRLKQIIREEFSLGEARFPDKTVDEMIKDVLARFRKADDVITYDDGIIDEIHQLGLTDEAAEPGTLEGDMWAAISNYYEASTKIIEMLKRAADAYQGDYDVPRSPYNKDRFK